MKNIYKKINRTKYSLGELISIVGSCARNSRETIAAMADLLDSGRVVIRKNGRARRVRVEYARLISPDAPADVAAPQSAAHPPAGWG